MTTRVSQFVNLWFRAVINRIGPLTVSYSSISCSVNKCRGKSGSMKYARNKKYRNLSCVWLPWVVRAHIEHRNIDAVWLPWVVWAHIEHRRYCNILIVYTNEFPYMLSHFVCSCRVRNIHLDTNYVTRLFVYFLICVVSSSEHLNSCRKRSLGLYTPV
jgi:hypothetical protein